MYHVVNTTNQVCSRSITETQKQNFLFKLLRTITRRIKPMNVVYIDRLYICIVDDDVSFFWRIVYCSVYLYLVSNCLHIYNGFFIQFLFSMNSRLLILISTSIIFSFQFSFTLHKYWLQVTRFILYKYNLFILFAILYLIQNHHLQAKSYKWPHL